MLSSVPAATESVTLPWTNLAKADFKDGDIPVVTWLQAFWKSIAEGALLPYRLWRFFQYDQTYHAQPDLGRGGEESPAEWSASAARTDWGARIGLDVAGPGPERQSVVAVIDSGVDYNHPVIHSALWLNPSPGSDARGGHDRYGWDFVSGDGRPYDDGYHGTWLASAVLAVAPRARILPLKAFNPWGVTSSSALLASFRYAVDHGADVILCGWSTRRPSAAIAEGVAYARARGVLVVAAAGDRGDNLKDVAAYPASLAPSQSNVLAVTSVDRADGLVRVHGRHASYGPGIVGLAAPGLAIQVAEPRGRETGETSTAIAAALVAGAAARLEGDASSRIRQLLDRAERIPELEDAVEGGRRLVVQ